MYRHKYRHDGDALKGRQTRPIPTDAFVFRPSLLKYLMANPLTNKSIQTPSIKLMPHLHQQHFNVASLPSILIHMRKIYTNHYISFYFSLRRADLPVFFHLWDGDPNKYFQRKVQKKYKSKDTYKYKFKYKYKCKSEVSE